MSYLDAAANNAWSAADTAAERTHLGTQFLFQPIHCGEIAGTNARVGATVSCRPRSQDRSSFRGWPRRQLCNSVLLHDSCVSVHCPDWVSLHFSFTSNFLHTLGIFQGLKIIMGLIIIILIIIIRQVFIRRRNRINWDIKAAKNVTNRYYSRL